MNLNKTKARIEELKHQAQTLRTNQDSINEHSRRLKGQAASVGLAAKAIEEQAEEMAAELQSA